MARNATSPSPKRRARRTKVVTTVNLEPRVRAYLDLLMAEHDRDRSYIVNALIKRHMAQAGPEAAPGGLCPPALK